MSTPSDRPGPAMLLRRWIPSTGTAVVLGALAVLALGLRGAVVTPKLLTRAKERFAAAKANPELLSLKWEDAAVLGTHLSTLILLAACMGALLTMRWWFPASPLQETASSKNPNPDKSSGTTNTTRRFRLILLGVVLLAAGLRLPLAAGSMWWDELWNVKYATVGEWRQEETNADTVRFQPASWARAAWYFNKPTNHPVLTLPSRLSYTVWQKLTGAAPGTISEIALRLPVLMAGLAALVLTAFLAKRLAGERAGLTAAALMAVHPWLIRYGVDARSYGLTVFFMAAALYSLERATAQESTRRQAWWWAFGGCQFLLMWSHVVAHVSVCAAFFVAAVWLIRRGPPGLRGKQFGQLLVINIIAAALLLTAFLPNLLQAMTWGERNDDGNFLTGSYFLRTLSQMAAGMEPPLHGSSGGIPVLPWWGLALLLAGGLAAIIAGLTWLVRRQPRAAIILGSLCSFTVLFLLAVKLTDFYFYHRFILSVSVPVILLAAVGIARCTPAALNLAILAAYAGLTFPQTRLLMTRSYAPFRETVADMRREAAGSGSSSGAALIPVGYGLGSHIMQAYYPEMRDIREEAAGKLQTLIDQARRENRPLVVALGYEGINRLNLPDGFRLLDDPALFERISVRHGIEPEFTFHLLRLK